MPSPVALVRVVRSGLEESVHLGHVAVCDADGRLVAFAGDPDRPVFARSSMKPLQAAACLRRLPANAPDELVAIACGSHNGEPIHVRTVRRLLGAAGLRESALACPPDRPMRVEDALRAARPRRIFHNCSGKHAGMVVGAELAGWETGGYLERSHRIQRDILRAVRRATGIDRPRIGTDGCGAPVHGVPLRAMATAFARLTEPDRLGAFGPSAARAVRAMRAYPHLVAGTGRSDTALMSVAPQIVCKAGAEGLHCAAILEGRLGVAVKIADGGDRAAAPALIRALVELGALSPTQLEALAPIARRPVLGGGRPVGEMVAGFGLRRARAVT